MAFALWLTFAGVHHDEPGWNVNSRFALTRAVVDRRTFVVDGYVDLPGRDTYTEDRSIKGGRYYCDKIIGTSLLGVPAYGLAKLAAWALGVDLTPAAARYLTTIGSVSICAAAAGAVMSSILVALGATVAEAFLLTLAMCFGTMLWGYSTLFASYLPAICFALVAYNLMLRSRLAGGIGPRDMALSGAALGAALLCEYTVGLIAAALTVYGLVYGRPRWGILLHWALAAAVLSLFAAYSWICFGEVCIPYKYLENRLFADGMAEGVQGVTGFNPAVLYYITIHPYRGLFILSPVLVVSLVGLALMGRRSRGRIADALLCGAVFLAYLIFNSSYYMWWGGWTMGPRHLLPSLPFLIPPLLWVLRWNRWAAGVLGVTLVASIWLVAVPTLVDPQIHQGYPWPILLEPKVYHDYRSPVFVECWPAFFGGRAAWNAATLHVLRGPWHFLVLVGAWIFSAAGFLRADRR